MLEKWWERWPGLLQYELDELRAAEIPFELDEAAFSNGLVVIRLTPTVEGEPLDLIARFPDFYPYFRFEVAAPSLNLAHHQHPFTKNLCLIGRATENWSVDDTLAQYILERVPKTLRSGRSNILEEVTNLEQHQGEPFSDYYPYLTDAMVLVDSSFMIDPSIPEGRLIIGLKASFKPNVKSPQPKLPLRGAILDITDQAGPTIARADPMLAREYLDRLEARWIRIAQPLAERDLPLIHESLTPKNSNLRKTRWKRVLGGQIDVVAVLFPEEVAWRKDSDGWLFVILVRPNSKHINPYSVFVRTGRAGRIDLAARIPATKNLQNHSITLIGLGAVGAPSAMELAKAGIGGLRIMDHDFVDPGTISRWPIGIVFAGLNKADAIREFIEASYPYTKIVTYVNRVGGIHADAPRDLKAIEEAFSDASLIYDATAEDGVNHFLSELAAEQKLPYIRTSTTPGAWGGYVARIRPGKTEGCWVCLKRWFQDQDIPLPPFDDNGEVQPAGCADPTFTGTSFDIEEISLMGARLAVSTLTSEATNGYPQFDWDVAVLSLRDSDGNPIPPTWSTYSLHRHPECKSKIHDI